MGPDRGRGRRDPAGRAPEPPAETDADTGRSVPASVQPIYFHQGAGAVVVMEGQCLAVRRTDSDEWVFPKGHLEEGERAEDAAVREVREETGLEIEILAPLGGTRYGFGSRRHRKAVAWFLARPVGGRLRLEAAFGEARYLDSREAQVVLTHAADRELATRALRLAAEHDFGSRGA